MTKPKQKLELTWVGKGEEPKLETPHHHHAKAWSP